ncbi:MAG: PAS domain-containing protein [Candidatus Rokubacteria bacterium]|nr:PAS domain-containing protein [Candidatus Rokubacteria bacterium]
MTEHFAILALTTLANLTLGLAVWFRNPSQRINRYFGIFSAAVAAWTLSNGLVNAFAVTHWGVIWARMAFASASAIPLFFFLFASAFPSPRPAPSRMLSRLFTATGVGAFLVSFTPLIATSTSAINGVLHVTYGPLHPLFGVYFISCLSYSLFFLARKLRILKGIENLQVRYVFLAVLLPILGGTITNLIVPLAFRSSRFSPYGPLFSILMIALIAHSIIRYRLMNIRLVIRRSVTYLLAVAVAGGVFVLLVWLSSGLLGSRPRDLPLWMELTLVLLIALLFQPLKRWGQGWVDRYFFREPYDYQRAIREITRTMAGILDLDALLHYACEAIAKTVKPEFVAVYTLDLTAPTYRRLAIRRSIEVGEIQGQEVVHASSALLTLLSKRKTHVLGDELKRLASDAETQAVLEDLRRLGSEFVMPILEDEKLTGFFLMGPKLSGDPYFSEDIDLFSTLVSQAAIALKNAQLYREVVLVNEYIENILATMESGVVAVAADGTVTLFNSAAERMTRLRAKDIKDNPPNTLPSPLAESLEATIKDGQPRPHLETVIQDDAGNLTPVICSTSTLRDRSGTILGAVAVFSDLTRLKELEGEKQRAERLASIGALASGIAHEIKNPLVAIKTFAELLPERFTEADFRGEFSKVVTREIERIDELVARLRGLATPAARSLTPVDLKVPIEETLALLRGQLKQAHITVKSAYPSELPLVAGDPAQLKQLFLNLFMNALEAMEPGGELSIRLTTREYFGNQSVVADIEDTGSGIPESLVGRIFDPFVTTKPRGSGLGLSICRGIADAHRATIRAQNNSDARGATIVIEFPVAQDVPTTIKT